MLRVIGAMVVCIAGASGAWAEPLPFGDGQWKLEGAARIERLDDREVVSVESGTAVRRDVRLQDGTIEMEVQLTRRRSFVYVNFRMQDEREYEELYLRPHKSGLPDATQYAPVLQGQSAWQLYHGAGATSAVAFEPGAWTRVRIVMQGRRVALFLGDEKAPALVVPRTAHAPRAGYIALRGFLPGGVPGTGPIARFANVVLKPGVVDYDFAGAPEPADPGPGTIREWAVSAAFPVKAIPAGAPAPAAITSAPAPPSAAAMASLTRAPIEPGGHVWLHRHVPLPAGSRAGTAAARVHIRAATASLRVFDLGFSDVATVFLNGRPLFSSDARYSFDAPRREGLLGFDQARLFLPLVAGDNELVVVVEDVFGGWALMGRFADPTGLEVEAR